MDAAQVAAQSCLRYSQQQRSVSGKIISDIDRGGCNICYKLNPRNTKLQV